MINLVYEHEWKPNIWFPITSGQNKNDIHWCHKYNRQIPWMFQFFLPDIRIISPDDIDSVDSFIYPVLMQEPFIQIRALISNHHEDFGFWSMIDTRVVKSLREGKGCIIIDATMEPPNSFDLEQALESLKDNSQFPNDRLHLNISDQRHIDNKNIHCFPSFLELHFCARHLWDPHNTFVMDIKGKNKQYRFHIPLDYENPYHPTIVDYGFTYPKKRYLLLNKRVDKHLGAVFINFLLDRYDQLRDGLVSLDFQGDHLVSLFEDLKHQTNDTKFIDMSLEPLSTAHENTTDNFLVISKAMDVVDFNVVVEAYFSDNVIDWPLITEKIWRNVASDKIFIVIGQHNTLKWFQQLGYKSFHPLIDESYDDEASDYTRIMLAYIQIDKLIKLPQDEMDSLKISCEPIFRHNESNFEKRVLELREWIDAKIR
ncbi:MAG: hypothetical protein ACO3MF_04465 [Acholeplasmataceae bacterium]